ncbi:ribosome maturation factor RimP [Romeria aff. gracilis LEGE 07310]|uniref:Ribosome maturation factor RimP n=1 Tax=Vasconcelosia minhoensis LEGE 07310 TaxID=915328 RepID=A0A8J7DMI1_9CYAN|nr:ribosome maturation factor RimP [Romeria gracilis]MBE9078816.1 ribosome maturation factor RimP [Romeria aff. gracilis LEGE 07310]
MTHPLIPEVLALATPIADELGLEVVDTVFQTNQSPPVLRIDVRNPQAEDTSLEDCERMSVALEDVLDGSAIIPDAYVLEVSSPGVSEQLTSDRDFSVFKGFMVEVQLAEPHQGKRTWVGRLVRRDDQKLALNQKGRAISIPRELVQTVQLSNQVDE